MNGETLERLAKPYVEAREAAEGKLSGELKRLRDRIQATAEQNWGGHQTVAISNDAIIRAVSPLVEALGSNEVPLLIGYFQAVYQGACAGAQYHGSAACGGRNSGWEIPAAILSALKERQSSN